MRPVTFPRFARIPMPTVPGTATISGAMATFDLESGLPTTPQAQKLDLTSTTSHAVVTTLTYDDDVDSGDEDSGGSENTIKMTRSRLGLGHRRRDIDPTATIPGHGDSFGFGGHAEEQFVVTGKDSSTQGDVHELQPR